MAEKYHPWTCGCGHVIDIRKWPSFEGADEINMRRLETIAAGQIKVHQRVCNGQPKPPKKNRAKKTGVSP